MEPNWNLTMMESNWTVYPRAGLRSPNFTNSTGNLQENFEIALEDTNWILTSSFIIFTMQTGELSSFHRVGCHIKGLWYDIIKLFLILFMTM